MTQSEKRIKIAEACGWEWLTRKNDNLSWLFPKGLEAKGIMLGHVHGPEFVKEVKGSRRCGFGVLHAPDYFNDLNACHEMEAILTDDEYSKYGWTLLGDGKFACRDFLGAKAAQRAEAFGLTLGLWEEGE
jgi:hypothetical protein